jgi:hypothetical protein
MRITHLKRVDRWQFARELMVVAGSALALSGVASFDGRVAAVLGGAVLVAVGLYGLARSL